MNLCLLFRKSLEPSGPIFPLYHPIALPRLGTPLTPLTPLSYPAFSSLRILHQIPKSGESSGVLPSSNRVSGSCKEGAGD